MKIICLSFSESAEDKKAWSGTVYKVCSSIKKSGCSLDFLCCKVSKSFFEIIEIAFFKILNLFGFSSKKYLSGFTFRRRNNIAKMLEKKDFCGYNYVFVIANSAIASAYNEARHRHPEWPNYIFLADSTFSGVENYYPEFSNLFNVCSAQANKLSSDAFYYSWRSIVSSEWAKKNCIKDYSVPSEKIEVVEFGANLDDSEMGRILKIFSREKKINLLLSGVDWVRKGGDIAVSCAEKMIEDGFVVTLHVAGMNVPVLYEDKDFIVQHGFLNKNIPEQYDQFVQIMKQSDVLLFPSKAECSAIALCEAAGFGLPVICFDTGGLANYVRNDVNGIRMPINSSGTDFAICIEKQILSGAMTRLSEGASMMYNQTLNWNCWTQRFSRIIGLE